MFISCNNNRDEFNINFLKHITLFGVQDFIMNLIDAKDENKTVEFIYDLENEYFYDMGKIKDIFISPKIANIKGFVIMISYVDIEKNEEKCFLSSPIEDNGIEYNGSDWNKYYIKSLSHYSKDSRNTIKIIEPR